MDNNLEQLKASYKKTLTDIKDLDNAIGGNAPTSEQEASYAKKLAEGQALMRQINAAKASADLLAFGKESSGSVVGQSLALETLPGDGDIPGVTVENGDMVAWKAVGEQKLGALKSGTYKDGINQYLRNKALFGEDWRSHMKGDAMKVLNEGADNAGGFWLPPDFRNQLISKVATITSVRQNATVITTGTDMVTFPAVSYTTDDKYTSGVRFSWNASSAQTSDQSESTNPVSGVLKIPVNLATASIIVQREQMEDNAFDLLGFVSAKMQEAFGLGSEDAYTNGNGDGQPLGFLSHPSASIAYGSSSTVGGVTYQGQYVPSGKSAGVTWEGASADEPTTSGILGTVANLPPQYDMGAKWFANKKTYSAIRGLSAPLASGQQGVPLWVTTEGGYPQYDRGFPNRLLGYPIAFNQFMPDPAANSMSYMLGDMKAYYIVDRVALSVEVYRETLARRDQVLIYARMRTGGTLVDYWRMIFGKCATS